MIAVGTQAAVSGRFVHQIDVTRLSAAVVWLAFFLIYSNVLTIGVSFHGLPDAANFFAPGLLCLIALLGITRHKGAIQLSPAIPWISLFLITGVFGVLFARQPSAAFDSWLTIVTEGFLLYLLVINAIRTTNAVNAAIWAVITASAVMGLVVLHQYLTENYTSNYGGFGQLGSAIDVAEDSDFRLAGAIGEVNRFAQILAMALPLALIKSISAQSKKWRAAALVASLLILAGIGVTFSRGVLVGLLPVAGIAILLGYVKQRTVIIAGLVAILLVVTVPSYRERVASLASVTNLFTGSDGMRSTDGALRGRFTSVFTAMLVFADHPVVGVGPGQFPSYYQAYSTRVGGKLRPLPREAHSLVPQLLADWGLFGVCGFFGAVATVLISLFAKFQQLRRENNQSRHDIAALIMCLTAYGGTSLFLHLSFIRYFWLVLGLAAAATLAKNLNTQTKSPQLTPSSASLA